MNEARDAGHEDSPDSRRASRGQRRRQNSVFRYVIVLFAAAFVLLLITFLMERRQNLQQIDDLQKSVSAFQTLQNMVEENTGLKNQNDQLQSQVSALQSQVDAAKEEQERLRGQLQNEEKAAQAMDWFWQINEAYVRGKTSACRTLIQGMEEAELQGYLPAQSVTDTGRYSPAERYAEIRDKVVK